MTVYGDLETSTLTELARGPFGHRHPRGPRGGQAALLERTWERVREEVTRGRQAYVVCPRIGDAQASDDADEYPDEYPDEDDFADADTTGGIPRGIGETGRRQPLAVLDVAATLDAGPLAGLRLGIPARQAASGGEGPGDAGVRGGRDRRPGRDHGDRGRRGRAERHVMVVMDAERFGVSQLHQLRGRVGRGSAPGLCHTGHRGPASHTVTGAAGRGGRHAGRVQACPGSTSSSAARATSSAPPRPARHSSLKLLQLLKDEDLIGLAREEATSVVTADPQLAAHPALRAAIDELLGVQAEYLDKTLAIAPASPGIATPRPVRSHSPHAPRVTWAPPFPAAAPCRLSPVRSSCRPPLAVTHVCRDTQVQPWYADAQIMLYSSYWCANSGADLVREWPVGHV